ncbi:MAG: glycosyltransferase [Clostridiales bacterium]|nr:glycosyltransferase [Clostridiales bacterium]
MKKILFFIESLSGAGAEHVLTVLIENLDKSKYDITVVTETDGEFFTDRVKNACRYKCFAKKPKNNFISKLIYSLKIKYAVTASPEKVYKKFLGKERYDVEIAFCEGYATKLIAASDNPESKKISWVHIDMISFPWSEKMYENKSEEKECYSKYDTICCVSESVADSVRKKYSPPCKVLTLYNPIDTKILCEKAKSGKTWEAYDGMKIISLGRLTEQKAFDRLLRIAERLKNDGFDFKILIFGKGSEREKLDALISELNIEDNVKLMGFSDNPYRYSADSDFFVCSSLSEGFSTVATECLLLGTPVVTTDCAGMKELFGEYECGIICNNDEESLYEAMKKVFEDPELLRKFSENCKMRAKEFSLEKRIADVEKILDES